MKTPNCILFILFLIVLTWLCSCHLSGINKPDIENIDQALKLLYLNKNQEAETLLTEIDTSKFQAHQMSKFQLASGFLKLSKADFENANKLFDASSSYITSKGSRVEKAEFLLLNGFMLERALLKAEAAKKYIEALAIYREYPDCDQYFYALIGTIRTVPDSDNILEEIEKYVVRNPSARNQVLLLNTKADQSNDPEQRQKWMLKALDHFDEDYDVKKQVQLYSKIAKNYQEMHKGDSAISYINKAEKLIDDYKLDPKILLHYYLTKAYVERKNKNYESALKSIKLVLEYGTEQKGILGFAHQQKSLTLSALGEYEAANEELWQYLKYLNVEFSDNLKNQIGLLSVQLNVAHKELEIAKVKKRWMRISLLMLLAGITSWIIFHFYIKTKNRRERYLKIEVTKSNSKYVEQLTNNLDLVEEKLAKLNGKAPKNQKGNDIHGLKNLKYKTILKASHPQFMDKIKFLHPGLTPKDIMHCVCILEEFTVPQAANITEVSESMTKKARRKLRVLNNCKTTEELARCLKRIEGMPLETFKKN